MNWNPQTASMNIAALHRHFLAGALTPTQLVDAVRQRILACGDAAIWIALVDAAALAARAQELEGLAAQCADVYRDYPLFGIPFAVKDNIDVAGMPTTVACPDFAYLADSTATVVSKLLAAGAILVGKTNLDQFATGLVGLRSPYGVPQNALNPAYLPGGSSSGSAVAVARGLVSFALGTDTAGSGRVPAALNNIVGMKPTRGLLSNTGVVPACPSLDCVSVFALCVEDALRVTDTARGYDGADPFSRQSAASQRVLLGPAPTRFRFAVPRPDQLEFFGNRAFGAKYDEVVENLQALGGEKTQIDFTPFRQAASLLYDGPWVAERVLVVQDLLRTRPEAIQADVRAALSRAGQFTASEAFAAYHQLKQLRRTVTQTLENLDCLVLPTVGRVFSVSEARASPAEVNRNLGFYTNFVNLLDLSSIAVPAGFTDDGAPFGISLIGLPFTESRLAALGDRVHRSLASIMGATSHAVPASQAAAERLDEDMIELCVSGAHMTGLPLNHQLTERGGYFVRACRTANAYRLFALTDLHPPRPGMLRVDNGVAVDIEVWAVPKARFGDFVAAIPSPLGIGKVELETGNSVCGFLCESNAITHATDISSFGGWRAYLSAINH